MPTSDQGSERRGSRGRRKHRRIKIKQEPWYRRFGRGLHRNRALVLAGVMVAVILAATWWFILPRYFETVSDQRESTTLADVVTQYMQSLGGIETIRGIQTLRFSGTMDRGDATYQFALFKRRPNLIRSLYYVEGYRVVTAYDGETPWMQVEDSERGLRQARIWEGPEAAQLVAESAFDSPLVRPQGDLKGLSLMAPTLLTGQPVHRVRYEKPHPTRTDETYPVIYYLDRETLEERLIVEQRDGVTYRTQNEDFRTVAGARLPHRITRIRAGEIIWQVNLEKIEANVGVPTSFFAVPPDAEPAAPDS
ncbi:MAG: hypothetical protein ACFE0O_03175 [Opitutales bacterium]